MKSHLQKLVIIVGPTASGKTDLAIQLAKEFNGEIISADSRQVYTKINIGTAKPEGVWKTVEGKKRFVVDGIPHYAMDLVDPGKTFTVAEYKEMAEEAIADIAARGKVPFLVGGTGLYVWAITDNLDIPHKPPVKKLRSSFEEKTTAELTALLQTVDPQTAAVIDLKNKRRLIRALEVAISTGESFIAQRTKSAPLYETLRLGIAWPLPKLYERIGERINKMWQAGLQKEVETLLHQRYDFSLPSFSGIGYRQVERYLQGETTLPETIEALKRDSRHYAKRQMTWFKRDTSIHWLSPGEHDAAQNLITKFLKPAL